MSRRQQTRAEIQGNAVREPKVYRDLGQEGRERVMRDVRSTVPAFLAAHPAAVGDVLAVVDTVGYAPHAEAVSGACTVLENPRHGYALGLAPRDKLLAVADRLPVALVERLRRWSPSTAFILVAACGGASIHKMSY